MERGCPVSFSCRLLYATTSEKIQVQSMHDPAEGVWFPCDVKGPPQSPCTLSGDNQAEWRGTRFVRSPRRDEVAPEQGRSGTETQKGLRCQQKQWWAESDQAVSYSSGRGQQTPGGHPTQGSPSMQQSQLNRRDCQGTNEPHLYPAPHSPSDITGS